MAYYTNIRYGKMRLVGRFKTEREDLRQRDRCVVRTDRGKEVGEILSPLQPIPDALPPESLWDVIRRANPEDLVHSERLEKESVPRALQVCREIVKKLNLPMKLTEVDYVWGGERIIFYFTSATRVDFRELVRQLAHEFRTRIELKQVGARDEARLVGDAGHCGLTLCCRNHLKELGGITMDMAKIQKHTADPSKITGRCGKLLCCLRYEYTAYKESRELLPARGARLQTAKGAGFVVEQNMLLREVVIEVQGGDRVIVKLDEIQGAPAPVAGCDGCPAPAPSVAPRPEEPVKAEVQKLETETKTDIPVVVEPGGEVHAPSFAPAPAGATEGKPSHPAPAAPAAPEGKPSPAAPAPAAPEGTPSFAPATTEGRPPRPSAAPPRPAQPPPKPRPPRRDMWVAALKASDVAPGTSKVADLGGPKVAVFNVDGVFHVISNECAHQAGPLGEGKLEGFSVTCPLHQWKFDVTTGACLSVSGSSVRRYECAVLGEDLYVKI